MLSHILHVVVITLFFRRCLLGTHAATTRVMRQENYIAGNWGCDKHLSCDIGYQFEGAKTNQGFSMAY